MHRYKQRLLDHLKSNPNFIRPARAYNDTLKRLEEPLRDLCVSRTSIKWGIPVPNNKDHVIYVWFDALNNYLSGIDYFNARKKNLNHFWPANVHIIGLSTSTCFFLFTVSWTCVGWANI